MRRIILLIFLGVLNPAWLGADSFTLMTWNIQDLGRSKDATELAIMVEVMKDYDLIVIQEVVAKDPAGARAVATLADLLNRKGAKWDYRVSNPTQSPTPYHSERYAYLWKTAKLQLLGRPYLDKIMEDYCYREPYIAQFRLRSQPDSEPFFVINFHSRKHDDRPEDEIQYFDQYTRRLETDRYLIAGDFNLDEEHEVWDDLETQGFRPVVRQTPTTLKRDCNLIGNYFNHSIDNIFYPRQHFRRERAGRVDFVGDCAEVARMRGVSDHVPVVVELDCLD
jgi:deoxyribonuclease-1-like protein